MGGVADQEHPAGPKAVRDVGGDRELEHLEVGAGDLWPQRHGHLGEARCRAHQLGHPIVGEVLGRGVPGVVPGAEDPAPSLVIVAIRMVNGRGWSR